MGIPTDLREETNTPEDAKPSPRDSPTKGGSAAFMESEPVRTSEDGTSFGNKDGVLDENANVDFKVERLQLNGLTEDEGPQDDLTSTAEDKNHSRSTSDHHEVTANGGDMAARGTNDDDLLTPQDGEQPERGEEGEEEEGEEEEEEPPEMTAEERKEMYEAVKAGDIDLLEDLLEKPSADINMVYFGENLLVTALKAEQLEMAEFLLDNGVDQNFTATLMHMGPHSSSGKSSQKKGVEVYRYACRQMAYDKGFLDIVEMIDILNGRLFPGVKPRERVPRLRRPPPIPTPSSTTVTDTDNTSSSSGDESDISGSARSGLGGAEEPGREPESSRTVSTSRDREEGLLAVPKRRRKKKKEKDRAEVDGRELQSEMDCGVQGERRAKARKKAEDVEKDSSSRADEDGSSSRRSGASRVDGNLTNRSKATTKSSERAGVEEGEVGVNDEGYETMSPSPSHPPAARIQQQQRFQHPPSIPVKSNKAFLALRRTTDTHKQHCIPAKYNEARPLLWKKVRSAGSYEAESPLWHQPSALSPKLPPPTPAGTPTTVCMLSPRSGVQSRSDMSASLVSTVELSTGNVTKPKILQPSHRLNSGKSSITAVSSASSGGSGTSTSLSSTYTPSNDRLYPLQLKVPSYMRMTTSCFVKRRLEPSFTNTYSSLDFVEPGAASLPSPGLHSLRGPGDSVLKGGKANGEDSGGLPRKSVSPALSGRSASSGGFPSVLDVTNSGSPPLSRKKGGGVGGVDSVHRRGEVVPNIRNNSTVLQTSKLTSAKVR